MKKQTQRFSAVSKIAVIAIFVLMVGSGNTFSQERVYLVNETDVYGVIIKKNRDHILLKNFYNEIVKINKSDILEIKPLFVKATMINGDLIKGRVTNMTTSGIKIQTQNELYKLDKSDVLLIASINETEADFNFPKTTNNNLYFDNRFKKVQLPYTRKHTFYDGVAVGYGALPNVILGFFTSENNFFELQLGLFLILPQSIRISHHFQIFQKGVMEVNASMSIGYYKIYFNRDGFTPEIMPLGINLDISLGGLFFEFGVSHNLQNNPHTIDNILFGINQWGSNIFFQYQVGYKFDL